MIRTRGTFRLNVTLHIVGTNINCYGEDGNSVPRFTWGVFDFCTRTAGNPMCGGCFFILSSSSCQDVCVLVTNLQNFVVPVHVSWLPSIQTTLLQAFILLRPNVTDYIFLLFFISCLQTEVAGHTHWETHTHIWLLRLCNFRLIQQGQAATASVHPRLGLVTSQSFHRDLTQRLLP
jgi:hypothetical protein